MIRATPLREINTRVYVRKKPAIHYSRTLTKNEGTDGRTDGRNPSVRGAKREQYVESKSSDSGAFRKLCSDFDGKGDGDGDSVREAIDPTGSNNLGLDLGARLWSEKRVLVRLRNHRRSAASRSI